MKLREFLRKHGELVLAIGFGALMTLLVGGYWLESDRYRLPWYIDALVVFGIFIAWTTLGFFYGRLMNTGSVRRPKR